MSSSVILSTVRTEVEIVENQSVMWLITVNIKAGYCWLLVCRVWFECIYLGWWKSLFILTGATLLLPTAAQIRHVSLLFIQYMKSLPLCWTPVILSCLNSKVKLLRLICSQSINFYKVNSFALARVQCCRLTLQIDAGDIQISKTQE